MTTASVIMTVSAQWGSAPDKPDKEEPLRSTGREVAALAARELRETAATREQALRIMIDWIQKNPDLRNVRQDESFLLRFLRHKKYSIPMAQQTLLKYLNLRRYYPESCCNLDYEDPKIRDILNSGYIVVSPVRDSRGRRVIIYDMGKFDAQKYTCWELLRTTHLVYESLLEDPTDQVVGFTHVGDAAGTTVAHITLWNPADFGRVIKWGEQSLPMRHKECHLINISSAIKYAIDFATSKVSQKMADRLHIHSSAKQLHKSLSPACLPTTYGGNIEIKEMITFTRHLLAKHRPAVLSLDRMELLSDRGIISSRSKNVKSNTGNTESIQGSFRKLEID